jgi:hypothetical protein
MFTMVGETGLEPVTPGLEGRVTTARSGTSSEDVRRLVGTRLTCTNWTRIVAHQLRASSRRPFMLISDTHSTSRGNVGDSATACE